jgi:hypothetical protein
MTGQDKKETHNRLYGLQGMAEFVKIILQMLIGIGIIALLIFKLYYILTDGGFPNLLHIESILKLPTLEIVSRGLAYSAGVELAYMLFTPGPDEAIEPLILGLAAALLLSISKIKDPNIYLALEIALYVLVLTSLFFLRGFFTGNNKIEPFRFGLPPKFFKVFKFSKKKEGDGEADE